MMYTVDPQTPTPDIQRGPSFWGIGEFKYVHEPEDVIKSLASFQPEGTCSLPSSYKVAILTLCRPPSRIQPSRLQLGIPHHHPASSKLPGSRQRYTPTISVFEPFPTHDNVSFRAAKRHPPTLHRICKGNG